MKNTNNLSWSYDRKVWWLCGFCHDTAFLCSVLWEWWEETLWGSVLPTWLPPLLYLPGTSPPIPLARTRSELLNLFCPGFMRIRSSGYSCSKITSLFLEKSCSCATDKWLKSLISLMIRRTLLMQQPLTYARPLGIWGFQIPMCKKLHSFFLLQSLWKTLLVLPFL